MDDQLEFDRLREACSGALHLLIAEAQKTEAHLQQLSIPASLDESQRFFLRCRAENEANENYVLASIRLQDFLRQHLYIIN